MIICYHKTRKKFYVIKDNTKDGRKFLFLSASVEECKKFAGEDYILAKSATAAMGWATHDAYPTSPTPPSDALEPGLGILGTIPVYGHPTPIRQREEDE